MLAIKKFLRKTAVLVANGDELEEARDILFKNGHNSALMGYDETYDDDDSVSSGHLHYDNNMFYLSKNTLDKPTIDLTAFKHTSFK